MSAPVVALHPRATPAVEAAIVTALETGDAVLLSRAFRAQSSAPAPTPSENGADREVPAVAGMATATAGPPLFAVADVSPTPGSDERGDVESGLGTPVLGPGSVAFDEDDSDFESIIEARDEFERARREWAGLEGDLTW